MLRGRYIGLLTLSLAAVVSVVLLSTESSRRATSNTNEVNGKQNSLGLTLGTPKTQYWLGEGVHLYARLTNKGEQSLRIVTLARPDVLFLTVDGQEVTKQWLARVFLARSAGPEDVLTLAPGQSHEAPDFPHHIGVVGSGDNYEHTTKRGYCGCPGVHCCTNGVDLLGQSG